MIKNQKRFSVLRRKSNPILKKKNSSFRKMKLSGSGNVTSQLKIKSLPKMVYVPNRFHDIPEFDLLSKKSKARAQKRLKLSNFFRAKRIFRFISRLPIILFNLYGVPEEQTKRLIKGYLDFYKKSVINRGIVDTLKLFKRLLTAATRFASGHNYDPFEKPLLRVHPTTGLVYRLQPFYELLIGSINEKRCALFIVSLPRLIIHETPLDNYSTITDKSIFEQSPLEQEPILGNYFRRVEESLDDPQQKAEVHRVRIHFVAAVKEMFPDAERGERHEALGKLSKLHYSPKKGPNGACLASVFLDYKSLRTTENKILESIKWLSSYTGNKQLDKFIRFCEKKCDYDKFIVKHSAFNIVHSKIHLKYESWCKTRPIAIVDWFSQSVLTGLHEFLNRKLKTFVEDCSFDQIYAVKLLSYWTKFNPSVPECQVNSVDLTAATDRIPSELQGEILSQAFDSQFAMYWRVAMCDRDFKKPGYTNATVRYSAGQPMGMRSSWTMLAIWHNVCCRTAHRMSNTVLDKRVPKYCVIGDDVSICGRRMFDAYISILRYQGVLISQTKGFHPETVNLANPINDYQLRSHSAEMAKCVVFNGDQITTVAPGTMLLALENPKDFTSLFWDLEYRGHDPVSLDAMYNISKQGYKPVLCRLYASAPLNPLPTISRVMDDFEVLASSWLKDTGWYFKKGQPISSTQLGVFVNAELRKQAIAYVKLDHKIIKEFENFKNPTGLINLGFHGYNNVDSLDVLFKLIGRQLRLTAKDVHFSLQSVGLLTKSEIKPFREVNSLVSKLLTSFESKLALTGKDKRLEPSTIYSRFTHVVLKKTHESLMGGGKGSAVALLERYLSLE